MSPTKSKQSLLKVKPPVQAPLDPGFIPAVLANRNYRKAVEQNQDSVRLEIALERESGVITRWDVEVLPPGSGYDEDTFRYVERHIKYILWAQGGWKLYLCGPGELSNRLKACYAKGGERDFDVRMMSRVYGQEFTVLVVQKDRMPEPGDSSSSVGGHFSGHRIGFDLGASDYKIAAVVDGKPVLSTELPWDPSVQKDPSYHLRHIREGLKKAASAIPKVDAIGGSSAGIYINNEVKVASLFRAVEDQDFNTRIKPMFRQLQKEWNVPLTVINDGDVTALAGAISLGKNAMLGIAMGSSQAVGYLSPEGRITGALNELAFAPVDFNEKAPRDEWSGDAGVGVLYFSQQAVNKLASEAGITFPDNMSLRDRLKEVQRAAEKGDKNAARIFDTIGVYLGYTLPYYLQYYEFENVLVLGRVSSGAGGEIIVNRAQEVLKQEFPRAAERLTVQLPDEKSRRVGQAVAAASLPEVE